LINQLINIQISICLIGRDINLNVQFRLNQDFVH